MNFGEPSPLRPELNVTQLIDVVLLLLIFFMLSTSFVVQPGMQVDLPQSSVHEAPSAVEVRVLLDATGELFVENHRTDWAALDDALAAAATRKPQAVLVVQADAGAQHGQVVRVMDSAQRAGLTRLAIATRPLDEEQAE